MNEEKKIADKIKLKSFPQYKKSEAYFECTCGKIMVAYPFKQWKENVVNRMYKLRVKEKKKIFEDIEKELHHKPNRVHYNQEIYPIIKKLMEKHLD